MPDPEVVTYATIHATAKKNLLLGNGFSIRVRPYFAYESLCQVARQQGLFSERQATLFEQFRTADFEHVLEALRIASHVNRILAVGDLGVPEATYGAMRDALVRTIHYVHPGHDAIDRDWMVRAAGEFRTFENIYTVNYDLLLYWITGSVEFNGFGDFFWSEDHTLRPGRIPDGATMLHYLHGALFLFRAEPTVRKLISDTGQNLLELVEAEMRADRIPIFVSEGSSVEKQAAINQDVYLSHCASKLRECRHGITIYGMSLSQRDDHIIQAINQNPHLETIAYSMRLTRLTREQRIAREGQLAAKLNTFVARQGRLQIFDPESADCPITYP